MLPNTFNTLRKLANGKYYYSLKALEEAKIGNISKLPISIRIILESLLRNCDGIRVKEEDVKRLIGWNAKNPETTDVPFIVSRVILQDFTGVPLLVDLAAMRDAVSKEKGSPESIEPIVPVDLVIDHSVQVDRAATDDAFMFNLEIEFERNQERYAFLKWGQDAFKTFKVVPPGIGIVHQVNLENIATVVDEKNIDGSEVLFFDTLVGTDSHTTMINGLGVVGWGVGGIEAEAAMLGQSVSLQTPEVIGVKLTGSLNPGVTATDLTLRITEMLRQEKVVGKFIEFYGEGAASLTVADRATIGNMAPEYGATMGYFPIDDKTIEYLLFTGRDKKKVEQIKEYLKAQNLFGIPTDDFITYTKTLHLDLNTVLPCVSGPKRPQDRINLSDLKQKFETLLKSDVNEGGYSITSQQFPRICIHPGGSFSLNRIHESGGTSKLEPGSERSWGEAEMVTNRPLNSPVIDPGYEEGHENQEDFPKDESVCDAILTHGSVVIAAITSCTNTSNPAVMIAAGLLAKKAVEKGLKVNPTIKTSLAPGSRVVTDYLKKLNLDTYLNQLGFQLVAYGCTTCIGNSGPLEERIENAIKEHDLVAASVLSGNRNFEARIHSAVKANFLMSPPLVVAFAIAGKINIDLTKEPLAFDTSGKPVYLKDIWPSDEEVKKAMSDGIQPPMFQKRYANILKDNPVWDTVETSQGLQYKWDLNSTYIQAPPYFETFNAAKINDLPILSNMQALALFGDSVTTDHISPAGSFGKGTPAGKYLLSLGVKESEFNSYGSRRGNHHVMMRGTFANVRIRNKMAEGKEGGYTKFIPDGSIIPIFDACEKYQEKNIPLIIFAGKDYGMGSSRDWAAKGPMLLGVKVIVAKSFERIHRSNLIGMGILPLEFKDGEDASTLGITGDEIFSLKNGSDKLTPKQQIILEIKKNGHSKEVTLTSRLDTPIEIEYYKNGGILPYVLRNLMK